MAKFKVGDRVRIIESACGHSGLTGVIYDKREGYWAVDIDGVGKANFDYPESEGYFFGYRDNQLAPLVPPDELAWERFREDHLTPKTHLVQAAENSEYVVYGNPLA